MYGSNLRQAHRSGIRGNVGPLHRAGAPLFTSGRRGYERAYARCPAGRLRLGFAFRRPASYVETFNATVRLEFLGCRTPVHYGNCKTL
jgi:hypothetical protein